MATTAMLCAESALNTDTLSEVRDCMLLSPHSTADWGEGEGRGGGRGGEGEGTLTV